MSAQVFMFGNVYYKMIEGVIYRRTRSNGKWLESRANEKTDVSHFWFTVSQQGRSIGCCVA